MRYHNQYLYLIIGSHLCVIMIQIYMYGINLQYIYAIQKEERIQRQLERTIKDYEQRLTEIQNLSVMREKATTQLHMKPLSLSKIHTIEKS